MQHARARKLLERQAPVEPATVSPPAQVITMLPRLAADLFERMTDDERLEFLRLVGAERLERWLATLELSGEDVDELIEQARRDVAAGRESEVRL